MANEPKQHSDETSLSTTPRNPSPQPSPLPKGRGRNLGSSGWSVSCELFCRAEQSNAMKVHRVITSGACVAAVIGLAIWLAVEHQVRLRSGDEHNALEQQLKQMAGLIAENAQLSNL